MSAIVDEVKRIFTEKGSQLYFGEQVTEEAHGLQAAFAAHRSGAPETLILAALFHDVGHLLHGMDESIAEHGIDGKHEEVGYQWLMDRFGPEIANPAHLHVAAKRYLCTIDPQYRAGLSEPSELSLQLQGGLMTPEEVADFQAEPNWQDAVKLRHWDDEAKIVGLKVPTLEDYFPMIERYAH
jgi:[1-hydroxy-2-(trimethylamino)ethyl]phosphonate dioxygenase